MKVKVLEIVDDQKILDSVRGVLLKSGDIFECSEERYKQLRNSPFGCLVEKVEEVEKAVKKEPKKEVAKKKTTTKKK